MIKIRVKFLELDKVFQNKRIYTEEAWTNALRKYEGKSVPIKISGSETLPIGHLYVKEFEWPCVTFEGVFADYQFDIVSNGEPTFCGIGICNHDKDRQLDVVDNFTLDSIVITTKSDMTFEWKLEPESVVRCKRCKNFMETFNYFVKYKGDDYCENCFFEVALDELKAEQWKTDSRGKPYKLYEEEVDE